jgi:hypothetical protein
MMAAAPKSIGAVGNNNVVGSTNIARTIDAMGAADDDAVGMSSVRWFLGRGSRAADQLRGRSYFCRRGGWCRA